MKSIIIIANLILLSIFILLLQRDSYAQTQNITSHDCDLPITNVGLVETSNIFGSGIQVMGNVHNNITQELNLIENAEVVVELYDKANNLIGVERGDTEPTSIQPGDYNPFKIVSPAKANTSMIGSVVLSCSYSIYDPYPTGDPYSRYDPNESYNSTD